MKPIVIGLLAAFTLVCMNRFVLAESVYVTKGKNGPIFSNVPQPGAREIDLKPLNVIEPPVQPGSRDAVSSESAPSSTERKKQATPETTYRSFFVVYPQNGEAVATSTAELEVHLAVEPSLQLDRQHAFAIELNGRQVTQRYTSTEFLIPPAFWNDQLPPDNQAVQLDASIVDGEGRVLKQAQPVQFVMRRVFLPNARPGSSSSPKHGQPISPRPGSAAKSPITRESLERPSRAIGPPAER